MLSTLLTVAALVVVLLIVPGPDVLLVSRAALGRSRRAALIAGLGVCLSIACWAGLALLGINFLFQQFPWIHAFIKVAGGLYLLWMGYNLWRASLAPQAENYTPQTAMTGEWRAFRTGFLTNLSNPKAAVFFGSVFSGVLGAGASPALKLSAFAVIVGLSVVWFTLVAFGMSTARMQRGYLRLRKAIDRTAGTLMLGFGGLLLASRE